MPELVVRSADGTAIFVETSGQGRPLVIVSGALFARQAWRAAVALLSTDHAPWVLDRRGRGQSADSASYAPEREVEDVLAVLAAEPGPVDLLGHSSGAILALQVAARAPVNLARLVVYEPPVFFREQDRIAGDLPERLDALLASGERAAAVETFLREGPRASEAELTAMRAGRAWAFMTEHLAHTVAYDARVQRAYTADPAELARITVPISMLRGGASPERMRFAAATIAERLPNATLRELPEQDHVAMLSAPALFAGAVRESLSTP